MKTYAGRLLVVASIFILSIGVGILVTQEAGRFPLSVGQVSEVTGAYEFAWSPDGQSVAYISGQGGGTDLWLVPSAGGTPRRLTSSGFPKRHPRWSANGKWIAYVAIQAETAGNIHILDMETNAVAVLTDSSADDANPTWSPDSRLLAFTQRDGSRGRILSIDVVSREMRTLAEVSASELAWSPDGASLLFVSDPLQPNDDRRDNQDIFLIRMPDGAPRLLTAGTQRFRDFSPSWAPDSRSVAYASEASGYSNIYILDTESGARRALTVGNVDHLSPKWSPDGRRIAYVQNAGFMFHLFVTPQESYQPVRITDRDGVSSGFNDWRSVPFGMHEWSPDGQRIAFTHSDPARVSDIWISGFGNERDAALTNHMPPDLRREARFIWPELIRYRSFDGREIAALVYRPRGQKPPAGYPTLLVFRESLDGQHAFAWDPFIQFFVSHGYLVFAPNVRGSSGEGKEHRALVFGQGGDHDIRDAFFGLDRLSSQELVDTERVGVFGAGTGGYLAMAALLRDEARFKAAVSLYGVVDAVTAASYPALGEWTRYMMGSAPLERPVPYYERSIVNFIDRLRTPVIFLFAGNDPFAPLQQLEQFVVEAEVRSKSFDYRVFENEAAGWRTWRQSNFRIALEAMDALFEKYLLGRNRDIRLSRGVGLQ